MRPSFSALRSSYPDELAPCSDGFENQCAVRMSIALQGAGFSLDDYDEPRCSHGHARGAESLANHLWRAWARPQIFTEGSQARVELAASRGVVLFKDIDEFRGGIGDHIDLWDGRTTMTGEYFEQCRRVWFFALQD